MKGSGKQCVLAAALLAGLFAMGGCKRVAAGSRHTEEETLPNAATHQVYAGRATLLLPNGVNLKITEAEVNEVLLRTEQGTDDFEKKWAARVNDIRNNHANPTGFSSVDREWPGDHTVQFDTTRGTLDARTWERWGVLGDRIVKASTVAPLDKADEAYKALADLFSNLRPDGTPKPGDFQFVGGIARVPFNGAERIIAEWQEPVVEAGGEVRAKLNFTLIADAVSKAVTFAEMQQEKRQRVAQSNEVASQRALAVKELRSGPRSINGVEGEETISLITDRNHPEKSTLFLEWITTGVSNDAFAPAITLTGGVDNMDASDADKAVAQWTAALATLRFPRK